MLDRWGAFALILGSIAYIALMAVHPSHVGPPVLGHLSLSALVHGTALFIGPLFAFGYAVLAARLGLERGLPAIGLAFALIGMVFGLFAGTMSGLVIPEIVQAGHVPHGAVVDTEALQRQLQAQANYTVWLNRSFAQVHYAMYAIAMICWCIAWTGRGVAGWVVRVLGLVLGAGVLAWQLSGHSNLEAQHGALMVTLAQYLWTLIAASLLLSPRD
jgi:hypothetical protein